MADLLFFIVLFYAFILGARRGLYKEVVQTAALIIAVLVAKALRGPAGQSIHQATGQKLPLMLAEVAGVVVVFVVTFIVAAVIGRLILKKLRGKGIDDNLDNSAEAIADALAGDTTKGPVTLLTDPIASRRGLFYWSDKILGAVLGLFKGLISGYLLFALVIYADRAKGWDSSLARSIESSYATRVYKEYIERYLVTFPEYRIASSLGDMKAIAHTLKETKDPRRLQQLVDDPRLQPLRKNKTIRALGEDPEVRRAWEQKDLSALLQNEKVRALLSDPEVRKVVADVDWEAVRADVERGPQAKKPKPTDGPPPPADPGATGNQD